MDIDELIKKLQDARAKFGNVEVFGFDSEEGYYSHPEIKVVMPNSCYEDDGSSVMGISIR
jgi:hypothetical protein